VLPGHYIDQRLEEIEALIKKEVHACLRHPDPDYGSSSLNIEELQAMRRYLIEAKEKLECTGLTE